MLVLMLMHGNANIHQRNTYFCSSIQVTVDVISFLQSEPNFALFQTQLYLFGLLLFFFFFIATEEKQCGSNVHTLFKAAKFLICGLRILPSHLNRFQPKRV